MVNSKEDKLEKAVNSVIDTFKFHGVEVKRMTITPRSGPKFEVSVSKKVMKKSLEDTLDLVYWTLWTLIYGKYDESKRELKISLDYIVVE